MANFSGGQTGGNEQAATELLRSQGISNPSSGLVRYVSSGAQDYSLAEARQWGLPIKSQDVQAEQLALRNEAIRPAIESYEKSKPEISARYDVLNQQNLSQEAPVKERYSLLVSQIQGREAKETAVQGKTLANEYGKRGIPLSSGIYEQDLTGKTQDISQYYGNQQKEVGLAQEADLRDLFNERQNIEQERIASMRSIDQAIANLKAGAGNQAASDALQMIAAAEQRKFDSRFDDIDKRIREASLNKAPAYELKEFNKNLYSFNPTDQSLMQLLGGATGNVKKKPY